MRNTTKLKALEGREKDRIVFVVGSGPQLNRLSSRQIAFLDRSPTVGVNRTQYLLGLRYFISAYPAEVLLARRTLGHHSTLLHMRPTYVAPIFKGVHTVRRRHHVVGEPLSDRFDSAQPTLVTMKNVSLAATHLAFVLGASRIVYLGVEQTSLLHYYDERPELRDHIRQELWAIENRELFTLDHPYATLEAADERLQTTPADLAGTAFYETSHAATFSEYFGFLRSRGVTPYATLTESVVHEAGAELIDFDDVMEW